MRPITFNTLHLRATGLLSAGSLQWDPMTYVLAIAFVGDPPFDGGCARTIPNCSVLFLGSF